MPRQSKALLFTAGEVGQITNWELVKSVDRTFQQELMSLQMPMWWDWQQPNFTVVLGVRMAGCSPGAMAEGEDWVHGLPSPATANPLKPGMLLYS